MQRGLGRGVRGGPWAAVGEGQSLQGGAWAPARCRERSRPGSHPPGGLGAPGGAAGRSGEPGAAPGCPGGSSRARGGGDRGARAGQSTPRLGVQGRGGGGPCLAAGLGAWGPPKRGASPAHRAWFAQRSSSSPPAPYRPCPPVRPPHPGSLSPPVRCFGERGAGVEPAMPRALTARSGSSPRAGACAEPGLCTAGCRRGTGGAELQSHPACPPPLPPHARRETGAAFGPSPFAPRCSVGVWKAIPQNPPAWPLRWQALAPVPGGSIVNSCCSDLHNFAAENKAGGGEGAMGAAGLRGSRAGKFAAHRHAAAWRDFDMKLLHVYNQTLAVPYGVSF